MQNNFDTVKETFQQQVKLLTSDISRWTAFLNTAGNNYKYPFNDQVMIFDRKPNAVACATIDFWNKHERYVNKGTKGIPLLDYTKNTLKYVFDVSDTNSKTNKGIYLWQAEEKYYDSILESLEDSFGDLPVHINFFNDIRKITSNIVTDNYSNYFAELSNYNEESFKELCINSIEYIVISRCGENAEKYFRNEDFKNISEYNSINAIFTLGEAVSDISEMILRDIEKTVVFEKKLELIAIEKANKLMHNENNKLGGQHYERTNITENNDRRKDGRNTGSGERLLHPTMGSGSGTSGGTKPDNTIHENEEQIPGRTSTPDILNNVSRGNSTTTSEGYRQTGLRDGRTSDKADDEGTGRDRTTQSRGSDEVDRNDEQHSLQREGDNPERDNLRIIKNNLPTVERQIENIEEKAEDETSAFVFAPGNPDDFEIGTIVNIGINKYEILYIDDNFVKLYDEDCPIINKEYSREEFDKLIRENPLNDDLIVDKVKFEQEEITVTKTEIIPLVQEAPVIEIKPAPRKKAYTNDLHPDISLSDRNQFSIDDDKLGVATPSTKIEKNINAIKILKQLEAEDRYATVVEQEYLSQYVGWGGLSECFDEKHSRYLEVKALLDESEYSSARESSLTAFYTSPVIIKSIYKALDNMGYKTGNILEPSCGVGNFIGLLPESMKDSKTYGIELDSISGRIAQQLYQKSSIAVQGFEKTSLPDNFFDVVIGNVPFGQFKVNDKKYNKQNFCIHDYFFAKALDKVRPGGVVAFITSKGTLDKKNPEVRKYIAQRAELIGTIRLPDNAFKANAGTEVTSDIIFLKKRDRIIDIEPDWIYLSTNNDNIEMNQYFVDNPNMILGNMVMESTAYGFDSACKALENESLSDLLENAINNIKATISVEVSDILDEEDEDLSIPADPTVRNFSYTMVDGSVYFRENSRMTPVDMPITTLGRIKGLIEIRDCLRTLIDYQTDDYSDYDINTQQGKLNKLYDDFTKKYGLITSRANSSAFSQDSAYPLVYSLEIVDDEGNLINKADIFSKRTIKKHTPVTHVETSSEALAISLAEKAKVDIDFMSSLTDKNNDTVISELQGVIFRNLDGLVPGQIPTAFIDINNFPYVTADEYLSGDVRNKLEIVKAIARKRSDLSDELQINIKALEQVQPTDLLASEISVRLGATWIPENDYIDFIFETLETSRYYQKDISVHYSTQTGQWRVDGKNKDSNNIKANNTYGTHRINAYKIIEETLNLKDVRIYDYFTDADGKRVQELNKKETTIAQQKQELIKTKFTEWIWSDQQRRERLCQKYNDEFNNIRPREYDGQHIVFSGINPEISLRKHQINAIAHILYGGNTLLAHVVGAGKTFEMVAAAMESKRLGLCQKSLFVVPNHLTEQWASEFLQLYPGANILVTTKKNFETQNRKRFCARIATGDFDAVIMGHSQFEKIPMSIERQERLLREQLNEIVYGIKDLKESKAENFSVKQLEKLKKSIELKLEKLYDTRKDDVVTFEELGCDRIFIDEAHNFKNLFLYTKMRNVGGIAQTEAQKSSDLFMKCRYLDELTGNKGVIFATGTPISNSMVEMYTMQRYLQYDKLSSLGLTHFDSWASTFGETETAFELAPEGTGYRAKTRFSKFYNLPELMSMFKEVADIQTADMLKLPVPEVEYHNLALKPTELQKEIVSSLSDRADKVRNRLVEPNVDNMLKITNDGRKLALDQRLINDSFPDSEENKTSICCENVFKIWEETKNEKLTQMVFCDISTPHYDDTFNVYDDIKQKLLAKGIPENEIAFIHDADTDIKKKQLFGRVRNGQIRVLLGSTSKMGAGTNVQQKLVALHHLDCPWRPSDLQQREGRIVRQGNQNDKVHIFTYVTENTFDAYLYQLVENKQKFISQIMTSKAPVRSAEDIDEQALSYAEIKALATGDPRIKEKMDLDSQIAKLKLLKASHLNEKYALEDKIVKYIPEDIAKYQQHIQNISNDISCLTKNTLPNKDSFSPMTINGITYTEKKEAGNALLECRKDSKTQERIIGEYRGFKLSMGISVIGQCYYVSLKNKDSYQIELDKDTFGNIQRIDNALGKLESFKKNAEFKLDDLKQQLIKAKEEVNKPFSKEEEFQVKSARLAQLNIELNMDDNKQKNESGPILNAPGRGR